MTMDREKEREIELESAMYTNCLLLGLDPSIIGLGSSNGTPRVGLFRHSNPKLGEQLLYFILYSLCGPTQSARVKYHCLRVWPIFDSAQSLDFRKVVQGIISELEAQGDLPRSNSRVSSLATCCGPRFVELLWQLSLHALREVHRQTFAPDVASNPLPAPLTDVAFSHSATLLPVTKAQIALERRRFLKNAEISVQRQATWSNLAHEMTAEFRGLCAEEAYLQQELEKLHDLRNKVKLEGELWDDLVSTSSQNSHLVSKATRLWDSILSRKSEREVLASGPIEDLIAHREHRYRISGSSLLAAMDQSSQVPYTDALSVQSGDLDNKEQNGTRVNEETLSRVDDRSGRAHQTVDVAEIIRCWMHALQRIHKQSLQLAKANDGEGPDILRSSHDGRKSGHAESLAATLTEHQQHLASFQVLINQLEEVAPSIQKSISECTEKLEKNSASPPALKLPQLFSLTPNPSRKGGSIQKQHTLVPQTNQIDTLPEKNSMEQPLANNRLGNSLQDSDISYVENLKRSVRQAALSVASCNSESFRDRKSDESSEHFIVPVSSTNHSHLGPETKLSSLRTKRLYSTQTENSLLDSHAGDGHIGNNYDNLTHVLNNLDSPNNYDQVNGFHSATASRCADADLQRSLFNLEEVRDQVFSPFLMDTSLLDDSYEDLLAPLSETETALMEH
ncbi:serine/threonine protein phosphatase 2A 59 kDa regulatory subunit B' eta isoform-like isoform X2 [Hibiscus syriacus]|uniref:Serine/threonine protein phosphatase 2A 59 kDa regulatory subunit B' eta isoform-like isoform X2 n=1 Tax=Hibiscus syriacus TaxID=106335 RepID=A0A6A2ZRH6_HIBSY|nr:serine/threonine protein phosphatase 2A 59 kDa regulatory subunit B' eta isoform-like isoform X2 [Hibiscus syriacus]